VQDAIDTPLVAARKSAMNAHAALDSLLTLANTMERLDDDGMNIVETMLPVLEAAYASLETLNAARPSLKPNGPHFRVIELAISAKGALARAMQGEPVFLRSQWLTFREDLFTLLNADELARLEKDILSEFDGARERMETPATVGGLPVELAKLAFEHNDLYQRLNKALARSLMFGTDPTEEIKTVAKLVVARDRQRTQRDEEELRTTDTTSQIGRPASDATPGDDPSICRESMTLEVPAKSVEAEKTSEATRIESERAAQSVDGGEMATRREVPAMPISDGPAMEGFFFDKGQPYRFSNLQWRLLEFLWNKGSVPLSSIGDEIYQGDDEFEGKLRKLVSDANNKLTKYLLRFEIISPMPGHYFLQRLPPVTPSVTPGVTEK
jgi:hypothetical protein